MVSSLPQNYSRTLFVVKKASVQTGCMPLYSSNNECGNWWQKHDIITIPIKFICYEYSHLLPNQAL